MKIKWRTVKNKSGENVSVPVIDVRDGKEEREEVAKIIKASKGKTSMYIPNRHLSRY